MDPNSITLLFNLIKATLQVGSELKHLMARVEAGEIITDEEISEANSEQLRITDNLRDME